MGSHLDSEWHNYWDINVIEVVHEIYDTIISKNRYLLIFPQKSWNEFPKN